MASFFDTFLVADALTVTAVVVAGLSLTEGARVALAARVRDRLLLLKETSITELVTLGSAGFKRASARVFGDSTLRPRFVVLALVASALAGGAALFAGALVSARDASAVFVPAIRSFALPAIACGYLALALDHWLFGVLARSSPLPARLGLLLLGLLATLILWLALMHGETWLEWQHRRTPLAYGSEWFYAEAYWHYLREPAGRSVSLAAGVVVAWPVVLLAVWTAVLLAMKLVRLPLEYLFKVFQEVGRGAFALCCISTGVLAKVIQEMAKAL